MVNQNSWIVVLGIPGYSELSVMTFLFTFKNASINNLIKWAQVIIPILLCAVIQFNHEIIRNNKCKRMLAVSFFFHILVVKI